MANIVPAKLKSADIQRFVTRAAQLEKFRPIVTYWCEYYVVNQILSRGLHTADDECTKYTTNLMDKLEAYKTENASNDAVVDDVAAKAYMENFANDTFQRADNAQTENKVTRQTADTFQAAATFLDAMNIWAPVDDELLKKSKYAKFHALRIARAIKAGEDPNATNPILEVQQQPEFEDSIDQELKDLEAGGSGAYRPPTVESVPDSKQPSRPSSTVQESPFAAPPQLDPSRSAQQEHDVSPIDPAEAGTSRQGSVGGGYFPSVPTTYDTAASSDQGPSQPDISMTTPPEEVPTLPSASAQPQPKPAYSPSDYYSSAPAPRSAIPPQAPAPRQALPAPVTAPAVHAALQPPPPAGGYRDDDEAVLQAQKHAKWAISALNFEDVVTAVKELRLALGALGAK